MVVIRKGNCYEKRVCVLIIAAVIPIALLFTGCADVSEVEVTPVGFSPEGVQLTVAGYRDALSDAFKEYAVALNTVPLDEENITPEAMETDRENARESCRKCREALNKYGTMNHHEEFAEKHIKLLDGVNNEMEYVAALEGFLTAKNNAELKKYSELLNEITDRPTEQTLGGMYVEPMKEVKAAGSDTESA